MKKTCLLFVLLAFLALCLFACKDAETSDESSTNPSEETSAEESSAAESSRTESVFEESSQSAESSEPEESSEPDESSESEESSEPEVSIPEEVIEKIDQYTTISKAGEQTIATVFDPDFVADIRTRREQGEILHLSDDEVKYIIQNTIKLFEEYDLVRVYDKDGTLHTYRGLDFMLSEEYFASFGVIGKQTDASFDPAGDISKMLYIQVELLHSIIYDGADDGSHWVFITDTPLSKEEWEDVGSAFFYLYELPYGNDKHRAMLKKYPFPAYYFDVDEKRVDYVPLVSAADRSTQKAVYSLQSLPDYLGKHKYDCDGKVVVVELFDYETKELITRIRFDEQNHAEEINHFFGLWNDFLQNPIQDIATVTSKYRAGVYLMGATVQGWGTEDWAYIYCPDGNTDRCELMGQNVFYTDLLIKTGCRELNEYLNVMVKNYLKEKGVME